MKPMLAKKYKKGKMPFPCLVQPKLDGIRALYLGDNKLQSRSYGREEELLWQPQTIPHILEPLNGIPHCFDGELYNHSLSRQQINSRIGVKRLEKHPKADQVSYYIFDLISTKPQAERYELLEEIFSSISSPHIHLVPTHYCHSHSFSDQCYKLFKSEGFEGLIYRDLNAPYGFSQNCSNIENRWNTLLKRKERLDMECEIVGTNISTEHTAITVPHIASLQLEHNGITFSGGGGLSNAQKIKYFSDPPIGKIAHISYDLLSDSGIPLQPSTELVYE